MHKCMQPFWEFLRLLHLTRGNETLGNLWIWEIKEPAQPCPFFATRMVEKADNRDVHRYLKCPATLQRCKVFNPASLQGTTAP